MVPSLVGFVRRDPLKVQPKFDPPTPRRVRWMPDRPLLVRISPMIERNLEFPPLGRSVRRWGEGEILFVEFFRNVLPAFLAEDSAL